MEDGDAPEVEDVRAIEDMHGFVEDLLRDEEDGGVQAGKEERGASVGAGWASLGSVEGA